MSSPVHSDSDPGFESPAQAPARRQVAGKRPAAAMAPHRDPDTSDDALSNDDETRSAGPKFAGKRPVTYHHDAKDQQGPLSDDGMSSQAEDTVDDDEEDEDDDVEAMAEMQRSGFIVDDSDEDDHDKYTKRRRAREPSNAVASPSHARTVEPISPVASGSEAESDHDRRKQRKKRRKAYDAADDALDEDDLALVEENMGIRLTRPAENKLKRLKRGRAQSPDTLHRHGVEDDLRDMFTDEEAPQVSDQEPALSHLAARGSRRDAYPHDDLDDFIADEDDDLEEGIAASRARAYDADQASHRTHEDLTEPAFHDRRQRMADMIPGSAGLDPDAWQDIYDIFGDGSDYAYAMEAPDAQGARSYDEGLDEANGEPGPERQLTDLFEPAELAHQMMTAQDDAIRAHDIPERMQLRLTTLPSAAATADNAADRFSMGRPLTDQEIEEETEWALRHYLLPPGAERMEEYTAAVLNVLRFIGQEFLEVPFIAANRRDYLMYSAAVPVESTVEPESPDARLILAMDDLWTLAEVDYQFRAFKERKHDLEELVARLDPAHATLDPTVYAPEYLTNLVQHIDTVEEIHDCIEYIQLIYGPAIQLPTKGTSSSAAAKRPVKHALYDKARQASVAQFAQRIAVPSQQFAASYCEQTPHLLPETPSETVDELARQFVSRDFMTSNAVTKAAQAMLAQEIGLDPQVRTQIRTACQHYAVVSVEPTARGLRQIDAHHPYYPVKFVRAKPVGDFAHSAQFLTLLKAEQDGLLRLTISLAQQDGLLSVMDRYYVSSQYSAHAQSWDQVRREVLRHAYHEYWLPLVDKYTREWLRKEAEDWAVRQVRHALETKLSHRPLQPRRMSSANAPRVLALTTGDGPAVAWTVVDSRGQLVDHRQLANFRDPDHVTEFIATVEKRRPDVIGIAGMTTAIKRVYEDVVQTIDEYQQRSGEELPVTWVNDEVARLYRDSAEATTQFPHLTPAQRYCLCLARYVQGPLYAYAALGSDNRRITHHPAQALMTDDNVARAVEQALVSVVNRVGVDVNQALQFPHRRAPLEYVAGLGPRKAAHILKRIEAESGQTLGSRADLIMHNAMTRVIFVNCASFLRVVPPDFDILDDTRIHPENYDLARKMATDALEVEVEDELDDDDNPSLHVEELMRSDPDKLNELLLEDYAQELEKQLNQPKLEVLRAIKRELQQPYADPRADFESPSPEEVFTMLTGETDTTLPEGGIVVATVHRVREKVAICKIEPDIDAFLPISRVADDHVEALADVLSEGDALPCVVTQVHKDRLTVDLSARPSDLDYAREQHQAYTPAVDAYFDPDAEQAAIAQQLQADRHSAKGATSRPTRVIHHPLFKPFRYRDAEQYLATRPLGDAVIRPSSLGNDHIAITWKVHDGVYQHVDVTEEDKDSEMAVGRILKVRNSDAVYSDLDELIVAHIEAMARLVEEMLEHSKYRDLSLDKMNEYIQAVSNTQQRGAYGFCLCPEKPGWFYLVFKANPQSPATTWKVQVTPNAYLLGSVAYPDVNALINGFKRIQMSKATPRGARSQTRAPPTNTSHRSDRHASSSWTTTPTSNSSVSGWQ
ncbi:Transcription elongation factor spt6 [Dimargaris verticillata]|uniref:Transcription elongation factor Spt6 n=1 Tax=Dimargaris verticillata TaxID=2761393 RepID=A0A9W8B2N8_9FUNG|nr:Transcription elongation factor spt6 [Dimargaris verticillata]